MPISYYNQQDRIDTEKALAFVEHIENHLKDMEVGSQVVCRICGKTIDEIYDEEEKEEKEVE